MSEEERTVNIAKNSINSIGFDSKWNNAHPNRLERQETINKVMNRWSKFISDESVENAMKYSPRSDDIFIATHSKAGTTMMQQIFHQLRSKGDINFEEISLVVPWLEIAQDLNINLNDEQKYSPRGFKTHFDWKNIPKSFTSDNQLVSKYIYIVRNPISIINSIYYFLLDWFYTQDEFRFCDLVELMLYKRSVPIWLHYYEWFKAAEEYPNQILYVFFEDLVEKREESIRYISSFINIKTDDIEERIKITNEYSSFNWMKSHEYLFNETPTKKARNHIFGAVGDKATKVNTGKTKVDGMEPLLKEEIEYVLKEQFKNLFNVESYEEFKELVKSSSANTISYK